MASLSIAHTGLSWLHSFSFDSSGKRDAEYSLLDVTYLSEQAQKHKQLKAEDADRPTSDVPNNVKVKRGWLLTNMLLDHSPPLLDMAVTMGQSFRNKQPNSHFSNPFVLFPPQGAFLEKSEEFC